MSDEVQQVEVKEYEENERKKDLKKEEKKKKKKVKTFSKIIAFLLPSFLGLIFIFLLIAIFFIAIMVALGLLKSDSDSDSEVCVDVKSAEEICKSVTVIGNGTWTVDEYIAGVVGGEVGVFAGHPEIQKALSVAARTYTMNAAKGGSNGASIDSNGNCTVPTGEQFQVFKESYVNDSNIVSIVQETSGQILTDENGNTKSTEYDSMLIKSSFDSSGNSVILKQRDLELPKQWLEDVNEFTISCPKNCNTRNCTSLNKYRTSYDGWGCGHGRGMSQWGGLYLEMEKQYDMLKILDYFYGEETDYKLSLASSKGAGRKCTSGQNGNLQPLDKYTLYHEGLKKLDHTLSKSDMDEINSFVEQEIKKAGHGTSEAVAAAGQALVFALEQKGVYLGYYWGGGHDDTSSVIGVSSKWGKNVGISYTNKGTPTGPEYGMDCSGFVSWATRNACKADFGATVSGSWQSYGKRINSLSDAQPGDVLADSGHVQLVVKNNGDGSVYVAEETSSYGLIFNRITSPNHPIYSMKDWYAKNCKK